MINYNYFTDLFSDILKPHPIIEGGRGRRRHRKRKRRARELNDALSQNPYYFYCPAYMARYGDLQNAFGTDCNNDDVIRSYWNHWNGHGIREGRAAGIPKNPNVFHCNSYVGRYADLQDTLGATYCHNNTVLKAAYYNWIYNDRHTNRKANIENRESEKDGVTLFDGTVDKNMNCQIHYGDKIVISFSDTIEDDKGWYGNLVGKIKDSKLIGEWGWGIDGSNYKFTPVSLNPPARSGKNNGDLIRFGDAVELGHDDLVGALSEDSNDLTFVSSQKINSKFYIRPVVDNGIKNNGDNFEYNDTFILAESNKSGDTDDCGYYGCKVATKTVNKSSPLTFDNGTDGKDKKYILYARADDPYKDLKNNCVFQGKSDFTRNGKSVVSVQDAVLTNKLSREMKPTEQELKSLQNNLEEKNAKKDDLYNQLFISYDKAENFTPTVGVIKEIQLDKKEIAQKENINKGIVQQYRQLKKDQKIISNDIQNMINSKKQQQQGFSDYQEGFDSTYKRNNLRNKIRDIYYVDQQTEELQHEMDKEQQKNHTYLQKSFHQKEQVERLRFWNQYIFVYIYYILAVVALFFLFQGSDTTISMKIVYSAILLCFPFIIYPIEKGLYWIYNYLSSFILGVPHDQPE